MPPTLNQEHNYIAALTQHQEFEFKLWQDIKNSVQEIGTEITVVKNTVADLRDHVNKQNGRIDKTEDSITKIKISVAETGTTIKHVEQSDNEQRYESNKIDISLKTGLIGLALTVLGAILGQLVQTVL